MTTRRAFAIEIRWYVVALVRLLAPDYRRIIASAASHGKSGTIPAHRSCIPTFLAE